MKRLIALLAGPAVALGIVGLASTAEAAPAASGVVGLERAAPASAVEATHYRRRYYHWRHRPHYYGYHYRRHPGIYLYFGPGYRHRHYRRHYW